MLDCISLQGIHLDPSIYLMDEEKRDDNSRIGKTIPDSENSGISVERKTEHQSKNGLAENRISPTKENENFVKIKDCTLEEGRISEGVSYAESHETVTHDSAHSQEKNPRDESENEICINLLLVCANMSLLATTNEFEAHLNAQVSIFGLA